MDSDSLTIMDVTESDAGVYTCIMNTTLDHDSASAELTVVGEFQEESVRLFASLPPRVFFPSASQQERKKNENE